MSEMIVAIALWCGHPYSGGFTARLQSQVQKCRDEMFKCVFTHDTSNGKLTGFNGERAKKCFTDNRVWD